MPSLSWRSLHRCYLEEPASLEESCCRGALKSHNCRRTASWKRRPVQEKENKKRRGRELTGLGPRCVRHFKLTLVGEEKEGRCCCYAPPISLDAGPWTTQPHQEGSARRELALLDGQERWEREKRMGGHER
jgi:hypothetical protein